VRDLGAAARVELDAVLVADVAVVDAVRAAVVGAGFEGEVTVTPFSSGALSREAAALSRE
jgi:hypothetical protein